MPISSILTNALYITRLHRRGDITSPCGWASSSRVNPNGVAFLSHQFPWSFRARCCKWLPIYLYVISLDSSTEELCHGLLRGVKTFQTAEKGHVVPFMCTQWGSPSKLCVHSRQVLICVSGGVLCFEVVAQRTMRTATRVCIWDLYLV